MDLTAGGGSCCSVISGASSSGHVGGNYNGKNTGGGSVDGAGSARGLSGVIRSNLIGGSVVGGDNITVSSCGSRSNVNELEIDTFNAKLNKKRGHNGFEKNLRQDLRYKFQLKKHIAYKVYFIMLVRIL